MEQEWTEDEDSRIQSEDLGNLSEEENSGTEMNSNQKLLLDPNLEPEQASDEQVEEEFPRRRSTRNTKKSNTQPSKHEEEEAHKNPETNDDEDQKEWKSGDKKDTKKRKRKTVVLDRKKRDRKKPKVEKESPVAPVLPKKTRSRGRPRKEPIHLEGEFDIYDEDKTPENSQTPVDNGRRMKVEEKDQVPKEVFEVVEEIHIDKMNESGEPEENQDEFYQENTTSGPGCSVAIYGLEDEDEESDDDEDRTLSADPGDYEQNEEASLFDPEELMSGDFSNSRGQGSFNYQYSYSMEEDDENTQYSVEAELARYAREDALMELRSSQDVEGNFDFHEEEDPEIQQELEQLTNMNENEVEYYMVEENGETIYYAIPKTHDEEMFKIERPIPPMEFDPDHPRQDENNQESEYYENYDEKTGEYYFKGVNSFEHRSETDLTNPDQEGEGYNGNDGCYEDDGFEYMEEDRGGSPASDASTIELTLGQLSIGGEVVEIPDILLENEGVFRHILSPETFYSLSEEQQTHLKRFLPRGLDEEETSKCISSGLTHDPNHYFGSPLSRAFNKIRTGFYNIDRPTDLHQLQDNRRVWYDHFIRRHYMKLLRSLVVARHAILEQAASLPDDVPIKIDPTKFVNIKKRDAKETIRLRARMRARMLINFAAEKGPEDSESSDESDLELALAPVSNASEAESSVFSLEFTDIDLDMYQPEKIRSVKDMLKAHKILKKKNPECPSLDFEGLNLEDVYERSGLSFQSERNFLQLSSKDEIVSKKRRKRKKKSDQPDEQGQLGFFDLYQNVE